MENSSYEQIVSHLGKDLELNGLEAPDELQVNTVTQQATQQNPEKPKPNCHHCEKPGHCQNQCLQLKQQKDQSQNNANSTGSNNNSSGQTNYNSSNKISNNTNAINTNNQKDRKPRSVYPPCVTCGKTMHSTEKCYFGANSTIRPPARNRRPEGQNQVQQKIFQKKSDVNVQAAAQTLNQKRHEIQQGTKPHRSLAAPIIVPPISKNQKNTQRLPLLEKPPFHLSRQQPH